MKKWHIYVVVLSIVFSVSFCMNAHAGIRFGQGTKTVTSAGTAVALQVASLDVTSLTVCADTGDTGKIAVGLAPVALAGSQQGVILSPGGCVCVEGHNAYPAKFDISTFKVDSTVNGEKASFFYVTEEN